MSESLRIAVVSETYTPQVNGVSRTLDRLANHLVSHGDRVQLLIPRYSEPGPTMPAAMEKCEWSGPTLPFYREIVLPLASPGSIRCSLESFNPQVVHIATEGPLGLAALKAARSLQLPVVSSYHTNFPQYLARYRAGFLEPLAWSYLRWFHNQTLKTFCPTPSIRGMLEEKGFKNVAVWGRGVDCRRFNPQHRDPALAQRLGIDADETVMLYVGRLAAEKNLAMLFDAWPMLPAGSKCRLLIIGDGPLRSALEKQADDRVLFVGYQYGAELARMYALADLFVFPSLTETFGNVVLEAMASGLPAVGFRAPGPVDIIKDGQTGALVSEVSATALGQTLKELLSCPDTLVKMAVNARAYAQSQNWPEILDQVRQVYHQVARPLRPEPTVSTQPLGFLS